MSTFSVPLGSFSFAFPLLLRSAVSDHVPPASASMTLHVHTHGINLELFLLVPLFCEVLYSLVHITNIHGNSALHHRNLVRDNRADLLHNIRVIHGISHTSVHMLLDGLRQDRRDDADLHDVRKFLLEFFLQHFHSFLPLCDLGLNILKLLNLRWVRDLPHQSDRSCHRSRIKLLPKFVPSAEALKVSYCPDNRQCFSNTG